MEIRVHSRNYPIEIFMEDQNKADESKVAQRDTDQGKTDLESPDLRRPPLRRAAKTKSKYGIFRTDIRLKKKKQKPEKKENVAVTKQPIARKPQIRVRPLHELLDRKAYLLHIQSQRRPEPASTEIIDLCSSDDESGNSQEKNRIYIPSK